MHVGAGKQTWPFRTPEAGPRCMKPALMLREQVLPRGRRLRRSATVHTPLMAGATDWSLALQGGVMPAQALKNFLEWGAVRQPTSGSGVPRTRVDGCKLLELRQLQRPPWDRRVLVHLRWPTAGLRPPAARAQEGQLEAPHQRIWCGAFSYLRQLCE